MIRTSAIGIPNCPQRGRSSKRSAKLFRSGASPATSATHFSPFHHLQTPTPVGSSFQPGSVSGGSSRSVRLMLLPGESVASVASVRPEPYRLPGDGC
jgi:hypothetical protein